MFTSAYTTLIKALVTVRQRAGLTQRELAERLGREQSFIGRIETGQRRVDLVEFVWICKACDVDPQQELARLTPVLARQVPMRHRR